MPTDDRPDLRPDVPTGRLSGWKEISAYLQRSVRTVQRWERESGLPVHRYPTPRGEAVYAVAEELDTWMRTAAAADEPLESVAEAVDAEDETPDAGIAAGDILVPPQPKPRHAWPFGVRRIHLIALALVLLAVFTLSRLLGPDHVEGSQPAQVKAVGRDLVALSAAGEVLWRYELPYSAAAIYPRQVLVEDLDADGRREVVVATIEQSMEDAGVVCLESDGTRRWSRRPDRSAQYGFGPMAAPWIPLFVKTTGMSDGSPALWVSWANHPYFGAFVERLDVRTGEPKAVFWNAGYVTSLMVGVARGRPALILGASDNEYKSACLAVYDLELQAGSSPAAHPKYACTDCPPGRPMAFLVFPKTVLGRAVTPDTAPLQLDNIIQDAAGIITAAVQQSPPAWGRSDGTVYYRFDSQLRITGAEAGDGYRLLHQQLEKEGRLKHALIGEGEQELFPLLSWDGERYVDINGPNTK